MILGYQNVTALLSGATAGTSEPVQLYGFTGLDVTLTASAALSAGTLIVEESDDPNYAGAWSQITSVTLSSAYPSAGGKVTIHCANSAYQYVRVRIGTSVVGGTLSASIGAA